MALSGTLHTMPLADLLQWLGTARKTGTLSIRGPRYTKRLYLKDGRIISSASDDPTEQLGQFLLSHGRITEEDLRKGLEQQAGTHVLLGRILLTAGAVREDELTRLLVLKAETTVFSIFLWPGAHFELDDGELPREMFVPISLDARDVVARGLALVQELRGIRSRLGSSRSVLARTDRPMPPDDRADRSRSAVLEKVDGRRSIIDICLALHASELLIARILDRLLEEGLVRVVRRIPLDAPGGDAVERPFLSPDVLVTKGSERLGAGDSETAVDLLQQALVMAPQDPNIRKVYDAACAHFREKTYREHLPPARVPVLARAMEDMTGERLTPEEVFMISRVDGRWQVRSIVAISPLGEIEGLRILKRLKDRGFLTLR